MTSVVEPCGRLSDKNRCQHTHSLLVISGPCRTTFQTWISRLKVNVSELSWLLPRFWPYTVLRGGVHQEEAVYDFDPPRVHWDHFDCFHTFDKMKRLGITKPECCGSWTDFWIHRRAWDPNIPSVLWEMTHVPRCFLSKMNSGHIWNGKFQPRGWCHRISTKRTPGE